MNYIVEQILKQKKITEYLAKKGVLPDGSERSGKLKYKCPLHEGDNTPSFYVYLNSKPYENYYCFGCKSKYHIIHLYSQMERVSIKDAVKALASGMEIDINAEITHVLTDIQNDKSAWATYNPIHLSLLINNLMYVFLQNVEQDVECVSAVEKMSQIVDAAVERGAMDELEAISNYLPDVLLKKLELYNEKKEKQEREILQTDMDAKVN